MTEPTRPTQTLPRPATDSTVSDGLPEARLSTRLDPSTAITQGVIGGRKFGGRIMNWIIGGFGDWLAYLDSARADLLSRTATLEICKINSRISASIGDLQALTGAPVGAEVYVSGIGLFQYQDVTTAVQEPWGYPATGMGVGVWIQDAAATFLSTPTDPTIKPGLINQNLQAFGHVAPSAITYSNTGGTPTTVCTDVVNVSGFGGSTLRIAISGLVASASGSFGSELDVLLTFNNVGATTHTGGQLVIPATSTVCVALGYDYVIPAGATTCTVTLNGFTSGGTLTVAGSASTQWLQHSILQLAA